MRAAVFRGREDLRLEDVPEPSPGPGEVKLRVRYTGICGSDLHEYRHGPLFSSREPHPLTGARLPVILGHELSGEVVELGDGAAGVEVGDLVAVEPLETCGRCPDCLGGTPFLCPRRAAHGFSRDGGGFADFTVVKDTMVHRLPSAVDPRQGALVEPMAVSLHAVRRAAIEPGATAVVHGAGPIGLGCLLALGEIGAETVVFDPSPVRRATALALGAAEALDPREADVVQVVRERTAGRGAAASFDAAGAPGVLDAAMRSTRRDGTVVMVAVPLGPVELASAALRRTEAHLTASVSASADDFQAVIAAMARGGYPIDGWVTTIPFERLIPDGIEALESQAETKVVVELSAD
jgi:(R,R)-butanediol dehydrogenase/meso-butanediol dehydrogenase/diacetyl reductase